MVRILVLRWSTPVHEPSTVIRPETDTIQSILAVLEKRTLSDRSAVAQRQNQAARRRVTAAVQFQHDGQGRQNGLGVPEGHSTGPPSGFHSLFYTPSFVPKG